MDPPTDCPEHVDSMAAEDDSAQQYFNSVRGATIMAVCTDSTRHGSAIYEDSRIKLVADRRDPGDPYKGLDIIIQRIDPSVVIVSSAQKKLIAFLESRFSLQVWEIAKKGCNQEPSLCGATQLVIAPNIWFSISHGLQKLIDSELVKSKGLNEQEERSLYVHSKVNRSDDVCAIRAISALENYLTYVHALLPSNNQNVSLGAMTIDSQLDSLCVMPIVDLKYVDPGPVLSVNKSTLESLNILSDVRKANFEKEGQQTSDANIDSMPSLYELLNQCQSPQGRKQLRSLMLWPLQDLDELKHRHDAVEFFTQPENKLFRDQVSVQVKNVVPMASLLMKLNHSVCSDRDITTIYKTLWAFITIIDLIKANPEHGVELLHRITKLDNLELRKTVDSIVHTIDFEGSKREKRVQVSDGIDPEVDEKKEVIRNLSKFCDEVANAETVKYKETLNKICRVVYIPRIGFLNSVEFNTSSELQRISSLKEIDILLHTENTVYFKTKRMEELDKNAGDIACDLIDVQESVLMDLQSEILQQSETILQLMELCGELDCLISFASVSFQRGFTRPEFITSEGELDISSLYHPLYSVKFNMVPNSVKFYKESSGRRVKLMIITGPNSCGKTTYMKATCLTVYMAHIGCFVPATRAKLPPFDAILTRMHSSNSISTGLSSFATDLHQINFALSRATDKSFIAIDEFGKGTQARDGFHLLKGLVSYFGSQASASPYVMVTTHYNRLIDHLQGYSEYILYKTFRVSKGRSGEKIIYEYEVMDGVSEASFADKVAAVAGIPLSIIERANQIRDFITEGQLMRPRPPNAA